MSITGNLKNSIIKRTRFQDVIFISGILVFSAALVLGLFPEKDIQEGAEREYFIYLMMTIPILAAIYFIFVSFSRKFYPNTSDFTSSIIFKMMVAFISVAILPSLIIIIISNHIINATISDLITDKTTYALEESIKLSNDYIQNVYSQIDGEIKSIDNLMRNGRINPGSDNDRILITNTCSIKGLSCGVYWVNVKDNIQNQIIILNNDRKYKNYEPGVTKYLKNADLDSMLRISNISIGKSSILLGQMFYNGFIVTIVKDIPEKVYIRIALYKDSLKTYSRHEFLKPYFQTGVGILLLAIVILIILISVSVSFFLSRGITRPVLELAEAAGHVASGDFQISLERDSSDEVALLFKSFNKMVKQLDESKKLMYHAQRLEAWREVARRIVHEIKNPLTPIRLSAERIQNRFREKHPDIDRIVDSGTETIIEEVKVLTRILDEFSGFARLPEMHGKYLSLNMVIENCVNFFLGHENISFHLNLDNTIPKLFIDKTLIRQALTNILQNSIDAVGSSGNIFVKSEYIKDRRIASVSIKDDGQGIEAENLEKIFDPTFSTKESGTGLGLAIVEKIVIEHNARIFCFSEKGAGAEIVIEFPVLEEEVSG